MRKSSIHIKPTSSNSERHNLRLEVPNYVLIQAIGENEYYRETTINERRKQIEELYLQKVKQKMQKKTTPIREGVVVLEEWHTMTDLKMLALQIKEEFRIDCFQIHLHRDEGRSVQDRNFHAHLTFDCQDKETGRTIKLNKKHMAALQTLVAKTLKMERGAFNSKAERLEHGEYREKMKEVDKIISETLKLKVPRLTPNELEDLNSNPELFLKEKFEETLKDVALALTEYARKANAGVKLLEAIENGQMNEITNKLNNKNDGITRR